MAAIEGFDLSIATGDAVVEQGLVDGVAVAGDTLDAAALADGTAVIVVRAGVLVIDDAVNRVASDVVVGSATIATGAVTAVSLAQRGSDIAASA